MRFLILLCTSIAFANTVCEIKIDTSFLSPPRNDLHVFLTNPQNGYSDINIGTLFSYLSVYQTDIVEPASVIFHEYIVKSNQTNETYSILETIHLDHCKIKSISLETPDFETDYEYRSNYAKTYYKLIPRTKALPEEEPTSDFLDLIF